MKRSTAAAVLINLAVFILVAAFLPRPNSYAYTDPISHIINSRNDWEIAWIVTLVSVLLTCGISLLLRKGPHDRGPL